MNIDAASGFVLAAAAPCRAPPAPPFTAVDLLEHKPIVTAGYECMLHAHTVESPRAA